MESENFTWDVFISYRRVCPDQEWVRRELDPALGRAGLKVWLDVREGGPGINIYTETESVIEKSRRAICVITPAYLKETRKQGGLVAREFQKLRDSNKPDENPRLIPLLLGSGKVPDKIDWLGAINWADPAIHSAEWQKLLKALKAKNPAAAPPGALRFYFVRLYTCSIVSFFRSHSRLAIATACLALLAGVVIGLNRWLPATGGTPSPDRRPSPRVMVENSPMPTAEPTAVTMTQAKIRITQIPPAGEGPGLPADIGGLVNGGNPRDLRVVVYAYTDKWYVQPDTSAPFTDIDSGGGWAAKTNRGKLYAALLVRRGFTPPDVTYNSPSGLGDEIVDFQIVQGAK